MIFMTVIEGIPATHFLPTRGTERLSTLSTLTQLVRGRAGFRKMRFNSPCVVQPLGCSTNTGRSGEKAGTPRRNSLSQPEPGWAEILSLAFPYREGFNRSRRGRGRALPEGRALAPSLKGETSRAGWEDWGRCGAEQGPGPGGNATPQFGVLPSRSRPLNAIPFKGNPARFTPSLGDDRLPCGQFAG